MRHFTPRKLALTFVAGMTAATFYGTVSAQELYLEEVVVTAQKRQESLQDVAVAVTALSGDLLDQARITQSADLVKLTPSLTLQDGGESRSSSFNIRGIGTQSFSSGVEPSVSTVVDGVVMGRAGMAFAQLMDVSRVEVLRGPQGMLFGKNASAGVVQIISNDPTDEFEANIGSLIEEDEYRINAALSIPVTDQLGVRIAGTYTDRDGYIENVFDGSDLNGNQDQAVRAKLLWTPTENLELKLSADSSKSDADCCQFQSRVSTSNEIALFGEQEEQMAPISGATDQRKVNVGADVFANTEMSGTTLEVNWDKNGYILSSITAIRSWESNSNVDVDGTPQIYLDTNEGFSDQQQFSQELRLASPADGFLAYVLGAYYFDQELDRQFSRDLFIALPDPAAGFAGTSFAGEFDSTTNTENYAAFGQFTFNLQDSLRLIAGVRYTHDELDFEFQRDGLVIQGGVPIPPQARFEDANSTNDTSFKLGAQWDIDANNMAYASWSEGYKGAAYNIVFEMSPGTPPVDAETSDAYELGLKSRLFDNRLIINSALFYTEFHDFQSQAQDSTTGQFALLGIGDVVTQGLELDVIARPMANWDIFAGLAYVDTEIKDLTQAPCSPAQIAVAGSECGLNGFQDVRGDGMPYSPELKFTVASRYLIELNLPVGLALDISYRWQDDVLYAIDQDANKVQEAYGVLDLALGLLEREGRYEVSLYVNNALDENYANAILQNNIFSAAAADALPYDQFLAKDSERHVGLELKYYWF